MNCNKMYRGAKYVLEGKTVFETKNKLYGYEVGDWLVLSPYGTLWVDSCKVGKRGPQTVVVKRVREST